jgi:hypothetical protein
LAWKSDPQAPTVTVYGVLVTCKVGPFTLRREYAAPGISGEPVGELAVVEQTVG